MEGSKGRVPKKEKEKEEMNIRTDIPLMGDTDLSNWIDNIIRNTNLADLQVIRNRLDEEIEAYMLNMTMNTVTKFCDKCDISYPFHTSNCIRCGNDKLREFKPVNNLKEILEK